MTKAQTPAPHIGYPFAISIKKGNTGKYAASSQFGRTVAGYSYDCGMGDAERQAMHHARKHADKMTKPGRKITVAQHPNGREYIAIVLPEIDPGQQLHITATYYYPRGSAYPIHRVRVHRETGGRYVELLDTTRDGGNGQHYETAYQALAAQGIIPAHEGPHGSIYWREVLEARDYGATEVQRRKDM